METSEEEPKPSTGKRPLFRGPPSQGPRLAVRGAKGCKQGRSYAQANLTEIKRILAALTTREGRVASAEQKLAEANRKLREVIAARRATTDEESPLLVERFTTLKAKRDEAIERVTNARAWRDFTAERCRVYLDHALATTPYVNRKCRTCVEGVVTSADGSTNVCPACKGTKQVRTDNPNPFARAAVPILRHISRVLEEAELCFKIRARTEDSEAAFKTLLDANVGLVKKFGNPHQTALEGDDAEQGAILGLFDGAKRFDPTRATHFFCPRCEHERKIEKDDYEVVNEVEKLKTHQRCPECGLERMMLGTSTATYRTYAWNWTKRNSRARKDNEKRPGLLHPSIDDPALGGKAAEDGGVTDQVTMVGGRPSLVASRMNVGTTEDSTGLDMRTQIQALDDPQQRIVLECILENMQPGEIATKLNISTRAVAKLKDAAFAVMRKKLASYLEKAPAPEAEEIEA